MVNPGYLVAQRNFSGRVDQYISDKHRLFARLSYLDRKQDSPDSKFFTGYDGTHIGHTYNTYWSGGLEDTVTFSPTLVGTFRLGGIFTISTSHAGGAGLDPSLLSLSSQITGNQPFPGFPNFSVGDGLGFIGSAQSLGHYPGFNLSANFDKMHGNHNIRFGADYRWARGDSMNPGTDSFGSFNFNTSFTQSDPFTPTTSTTTGSAMAALLLGLPSSGNFGSYTGRASQDNDVAGFIQDDWRIIPKLTLNFGLRYDMEAPQTERYNQQIYGFNPAAQLPIQVPGMNLQGGLLLAGVNGNPRTAGNWDLNNVGPRFGFAYQALPKTVIRGGYGLFYAMKSYAGYYNLDPGTFSSNTSFVGSIDGGATPYNTLANPFPAGLTKPVGNTAGLMTNVGNAVSFWSPERLNPYSQQFRLGVERELPSRIVADEVAYVGQHALKEGENFNLNEMPDQYLALGSAQNNKVNNPFLNIFPATSTLGQGKTITQKQLWLAYPQFTSATINEVPTGMTDYNGLQAKVEKRLTHNLTILTVYTFSKTMQNNTTSLVNPRHYRSIAGIDQPHLFRQFFTYRLPFSFKGHGLAQRFLGETAGGWSIAGRWEYTSGAPLSVTQANGRPLRIAKVNYSGPVESRLGDQVDANGNVLNPYFNIHAFQALPSPYMVSPEPPVLAQLRAPAWKDLNLSAYKDFQIHERMKLQFNVEFDQVTNSPLFLAPGTNMSKPATFGVIQDDQGGRGGKLCLKLLF